MPSTNHQAVTSAVNFHPCICDETQLFQVNEGVPAEKALNEAVAYLDAASQILKLLEDENAVAVGVGHPPLNCQCQTFFHSVGNKLSEGLRICCD